jgi:hypothetical protein
MRSGSRPPFPPFNAFHGRRYWCLRALSFLLKAGPWHTGARARPPGLGPGLSPGHRSRPSPAVPLGPAPARHRPCKAPVGSLAVNALAVSRSGPGRSQPVPGCRSPLASARDPPGPAPPGGSRSAAPPAASRRHAVPSALRPAGRARAGAPSCPSPGSCRPPHEVPARALSRCPLSRQASASPFPVLRMYEERTPAPPTTFLQVFS